MSLAPANALRYLGALATLVVGAVHLQQYADFIADVPTIGVLFLLNGLGAGVVAILLATRRAPLGALGGIALSAGALVSVLISMTDARPVRLHRAGVPLRRRHRDRRRGRGGRRCCSPTSPRSAPRHPRAVDWTERQRAVG